MRNYQTYLGIDVSKDHLDIACYDPTTSKSTYLGRIANTSPAIEDWLTTHVSTPSTTLLCLESTGLYMNLLLAVCVKLQIPTWVQSALHIKRSLGLQRGKCDVIDAQRIAKYAYRCIDELGLYVPQEGTVQLLQQLYTLQDKLKLMNQQLQVPLQEMKRFDESTYTIWNTHTQETQKAIQAEIHTIDQKIAQTIEQDDNFKHLHALLTSITAVGKQTATFLLIVTDNFQRFDNVKQLASYAGVAPFQNSSGKFKGKERISPFANKKLKALLHMCALTTLKTDNELAKYYKRKKEEGKPTRVILNAIKNKLLHRIWAVIKRNKPYEKNLPKINMSECKKNNQEKTPQNLQIS